MIKQAIFDFGKGVRCSRADWISEHVGMVCVAAINVWFTAKVEDVFNRMSVGEVNAMRTFLKQQQTQFDELRTIGVFCALMHSMCVRLILIELNSATHGILHICFHFGRTAPCISNGLITKTVFSKLTPVDRLKYKAIVIADMHSLGVVETFVGQRVSSATSFLWQNQLRFCWVRDLDNLMIQHCSGMLNVLDNGGSKNHLKRIHVKLFLYISLSIFLILFDHPFFSFHLHLSFVKPVHQYRP